MISPRGKVHPSSDGSRSSNAWETFPPPPLGDDVWTRSNSNHLASGPASAGVSPGVALHTPLTPPPPPLPLPPPRGPHAVDLSDFIRDPTEAVGVMSDLPGVSNTVSPRAADLSVRQRSLLLDVKALSETASRRSSVSEKAPGHAPNPKHSRPPAAPSSPKAAKVREPPALLGPRSPQVSPHVSVRQLTPPAPMQSMAEEKRAEVQRILEANHHIVTLDELMTPAAPAIQPKSQQKKSFFSSDAEGSLQHGSTDEPWPGKKQVVLHPKEEPYIPLSLARSKLTQVLADMVRMRTEHLKVCEGMQQWKERLTVQAQEQVRQYCETMLAERQELEARHAQELEELKQQVKERSTEYERLLQELEEENVELSQAVNIDLTEAKKAWEQERARMSETIQRDTEEKARLLQVLEAEATKIKELMEREKGGDSRLRQLEMEAQATVKANKALEEGKAAAEARAAKLQQQAAQDRETIAALRAQLAAVTRRVGEDPPAAVAEVADRHRRLLEEKDEEIQHLKRKVKKWKRIVKDKGGEVSDAECLPPTGKACDLDSSWDRRPLALFPEQGLQPGDGGLGKVPPASGVTHPGGLGESSVAEPVLGVVVQPDGGEAGAEKERKRKARKAKEGVEAEALPAQLNGGGLGESSVAEPVLGVVVQPDGGEAGAEKQRKRKTRKAKEGEEAEALPAQLNGWSPDGTAASTGMNGLQPPHRCPAEEPRPLNGAPAEEGGDPPSAPAKVKKKKKDRVPAGAENGSRMESLSERSGDESEAASMSGDPAARKRKTKVKKGKAKIQGAFELDDGTAPTSREGDPSLLQLDGAQAERGPT